MNVNIISDNLKRINEKIGHAAEKSGRKADDITLIAVTKTVLPETLLGYIDVLTEHGVKNLGENRVQELQEKQPLLEKCGINWHMIGHLQRNKVKFVAGNVSLIHSVDSLRLAEEISRLSTARQITADVLLEINIADEDSKHGVTPGNALMFAKEVMALPNVTVKGLMAIAPFVDNGEENRPHFKRMAQLREQISDATRVLLPHLSMGMTIDYETAIEEGADMVRIGTAIFGERT